MDAAVVGLAVVGRAVAGRVESGRPDVPRRDIEVNGRPAGGLDRDGARASIDGGTKERDVCNNASASAHCNDGKHVILKSILLESKEAALHERCSIIVMAHSLGSTPCDAGTFKADIPRNSQSSPTTGRDSPRKL